MHNIYQCTGHRLMVPHIVDSQGMYLFDEHGKQYMDFESGVWCTAIGHKNKRINHIIEKQIHAVMHAGFCYSSEILQHAAQSVLSVTGFEDGKCVFLCSGSEAIEISRQIAKHVTGKKNSMTLHDSYLGSYSSVINRNEGWYVFHWDQCKTCRKKDRCDSSCEALKSIPEDISEFIFEPGSSSGWVRFPPKAMIKNMAERVRMNQGKVIANEVTTGMGRTGKWFGHHHYDIEPDMIAIGKGIGNGYPVSVAAINGTTAKELERKPFHYAQSHQNDPLGAAIVKEVIQTMKDEDLISKAEKKGSRFLPQLKSLVDDKNILEVRGRGLMFALDLVSERVGNDLFDALMAKGYIVGNRKTVFRIDPPLIISESEFEGFIDTFREVLLLKGGR